MQLKAKRMLASWPSSWEDDGKMRAENLLPFFDRLEAGPSLATSRIGSQLITQKALASSPVILSPHPTPTSEDKSNTVLPANQKATAKIICVISYGKSQKDFVIVDNDRQFGVSTNATARLGEWDSLWQRRTSPENEGHVPIHVAWLKSCREGQGYIRQNGAAFCFERYGVT